MSVVPSPLKSPAIPTAVGTGTGSLAGRSILNHWWMYGQGPVPRLLSWKYHISFRPTFGPDVSVKCQTTSSVPSPLKSPTVPRPHDPAIGTAFPDFSHACGAVLPARSFMYQISLAEEGACQRMSSVPSPLK